MKYDKDLYKMIRTNKKARERYYKNRTVAFIMKQKYPSIDIPLDKLQGFVKEIGRLDRQWRRILELEPDLRGKDYNCKKIAEQKAQIELGYEQGYYQSHKQLKHLR